MKIKAVSSSSLTFRLGEKRDYPRADSKTWQMAGRGLGQGGHVGRGKQGRGGLGKHGHAIISALRRRDCAMAARLLAESSAS